MPKISDAEVAKLKKFSDAGRAKSCGCLTLAETDSSGCFGITPFLSFSSEMSLEEKVGQLLIVHFHGNDANDSAKFLIQDLHVGGIIYYNWANDLSSFEKVKNLSQSLQNLAKKHPLLIAADQEGGRVQRLKMTSYPSSEEIAKTNNPQKAEETAHFIGLELQSCGINFNLAPVLDVNSNPRNPVIGSRSFGSDPNLVTAFAEKSLAGYKKACILSCLKHFPGHGDVEIDSHLDLPVVYKTKEELEKTELFPFKALCKQADAVMTAHLFIPSIDPIYCSTHSKKILTILREEMGFDGVIISDSLAMEGVLRTCDYSFEEAAIRALEAGCDLLILGGKRLIGTNHNLEMNLLEIKKVHAAIVEAIQSGRLSQTSIDESIKRIIFLKNSLINKTSLNKI